MPRKQAGDVRRVLIYSHDTYGLGHLRRSLVLADALAATSADRSILVATGSPRTSSFRAAPGVDFLKLPSVVKTPDGAYASRSLRVPVEETARLRAAILAAAAGEFRPDAVIVDHAPAGFAGELRRTFDLLKARAPRPHFILGLRDVIDDVDVVRAQWDRDEVWPLIDSFFDRVLVYGDPAVLTTAAELGLPERLGARLSFTGYVSRNPPDRPPRGDRRPKVVVTTGGGGDGHGLLRKIARFAAAYDGRPPFDLDVVAGPLLSARRFAELRDAFAAIEGATIREFTDDFESTLAEADAVVAMAGYNTTMEILRSGTPALFVPRTTPRREQAIRAERLSAVVPRFRTRELETLRASHLRAFVEEAFATTPTPTPPAPPPLRVDGAAFVADVVADLRVDSPIALAAGRTV